MSWKLWVIGRLLWPNPFDFRAVCFDQAMTLRLTKMIISQHYFTFPFLIPRVIGLFDNWPEYLFNFLLRRRRPAEYVFRTGQRLVDGTGTLTGTIAVVFVRREYGSVADARTILDIGANMGSFAVYAARSAPTARIYCYEPVTRNFDYLQRNIDINSFGERVTAIRCAVAAQRGEIDIALSESPLHSFVISSGQFKHERVHCKTLREVLDEHGLERVDLLKMNCEGAEYEIFDSCSQADFQRIPNIRLEYHVIDPEKRNGDALARLFERQGYRIDRFTRYRNESGFIWATQQMIRAD